MEVAVAGNDVYVYTGARSLDAALPAVVFIHGAGQDHSAWALQSRYFAHHGFNVLAVDLPGHGRSGGDALRSVEAIADWIPALQAAKGLVVPARRITWIQSPKFDVSSSTVRARAPGIPSRAMRP